MVYDICVFLFGSYIVILGTSMVTDYITVFKKKDKSH